MLWQSHSVTSFYHKKSLTLGMDKKDTFYLKVTDTESTDKSQNKRNHEIFKLMLANLTHGRTAQSSSR